MAGRLDVPAHVPVRGPKLERTHAISLFPNVLTTRTRRCKSLELVRLGDNQLASLPAGFLDMPSLAWVGLGGNPALLGQSMHSPAHVDFRQLQLGPQIGSGASGGVFKVRPGVIMHRTTHFIQCSSNTNNSGCFGLVILARRLATKRFSKRLVSITRYALAPGLKIRPLGVCNSLQAQPCDCGDSDCDDER